MATFFHFSFCVILFSSFPLVMSCSLTSTLISISLQVDVKDERSFFFIWRCGMKPLGLTNLCNVLNSISLLHSCRLEYPLACSKTPFRFVQYGGKQVRFLSIEFQNCLSSSYAMGGTRDNPNLAAFNDTHL